ncbi:hypothetical protein, partial [Ruegeria sp. HKCCA5426]|uniref:hypothetical protein n=1 Tax=Ruegeria sp. HKCCA5426 TaxID=2682985 RepID=UPI001C2CC272
SVQLITFCVSNTLFFNRIGGKRSFAARAMETFLRGKAGVGFRPMHGGVAFRRQGIRQYQQSAFQEHAVFLSQI